MTPRPPRPAVVPSAFRRWLLAACLCVSALAITSLAPSPALAQDEEIKMDARLEGYGGANVSVSNQSTALIWLLFVFLGVVALAALFKDAKRTHLD